MRPVCRIHTHTHTRTHQKPPTHRRNTRSTILPFHRTPSLVAPQHTRYQSVSHSLFWSYPMLLSCSNQLLLLLLLPFLLSLLSHLFYCGEQRAIKQPSNSHSNSLSLSQLHLTSPHLTSPRLSPLTISIHPSTHPHRLTRSRTHTV